MSANLLVDLGGTCQLGTTITPPQTQSGVLSPTSGPVIGTSVYLGNANTACNVLVNGIDYVGSGSITIQVQTSDSDVSGNYTDPTSGLAQLPGAFTSGGLLILNSGGLLNGTLGSTIQIGASSGQPVSGQAIQSGFAVATYFQRPQTFARANVLSGGFFVGAVTVTFISQLRTTGSGGGYTLSPSSGSLNV